jgi:hypothetical protein
MFFVFVFVFALAARDGLVCMGFRWHPRDVIGSHALPLCGAAPTCVLAATLGLLACGFAGIRVMSLVC